MSLSPTSNVWTRLRERVGLVLETDSAFQNFKNPIFILFGSKLPPDWFVSLFILFLTFFMTPFPRNLLIRSN